MPKHQLIIHTIMEENVPSPRPSLIADLVNAVLRAPGMRVVSVEVNEIASTETITRRVRGAAKPGSVSVLQTDLHKIPHTFRPSAEPTVCACGLHQNAEVHR